MCVGATSLRQIANLSRPIWKNWGKIGKILRWPSVHFISNGWLILAPAARVYHSKIVTVASHYDANDADPWHFTVPYRERISNSNAKAKLLQQSVPTDGLTRGEAAVAWTAIRVARTPALRRRPSSGEDWTGGPDRQRRLVRRLSAVYNGNW